MSHGTCHIEKKEKEIMQMGKAVEVLLSTGLPIGDQINTQYKEGEIKLFRVNISVNINSILILQIQAGTSQEARCRGQHVEILAKK